MVKSAYENYLEQHSDEQDIVVKLADFLASCPAVQFQDPERAIEIVKPLLQKTPQKGDLWGTLGSAYYIQGKWQKAVEAFSKANKLKDGGEAWDLYPMAMCQWHLGQQDEAHKTYEQAVEHTENFPELILARREAEELLGIESSATANEQENIEK
jgi:uncharacterized protein HemY